MTVFLDNILVGVLDRFLPETYPIKNDKCQESKEILDDPQLALAMRQGTKVVHRAAENSVFTRRFLKGDITKDEYGQYLRSLYFVYKAMEGLLEKHKGDPAIATIYFPDELNREQALLDDLSYFYGQEKLAQVTHLDTMTPAVIRYIQAMEKACTIDPTLLVSHSYTRYLGDLSGGQILAKRLKKHILHLDKEDSSWDSRIGLDFYHFNNISHQNEFKSMYRQQLDQVPVTARTKDLVVAEAVQCLELNIALFDEIQAMSDSNQLERTDCINTTNDSVDSNSTDDSRWARLLKSKKPLYAWTTGLATITALTYVIYLRRKRN
ncbi:hypothetical protein BCR42DRAFT_321343 [Absidia repens]|uniref:Uncharacterized protein n=1 Tax=Absidia repens TaxID=90262 RepID=A0A1X2ISP4_9FUNG|nr:hypothetical protein BCR42DRAFT_321343 [Absidia repens]